MDLFFVVNETISNKVGIILLCSSMLAYKNESVNEKKKALNKSIIEMGEIVKTMRENGMVLNTEEEIIEHLLAQRGLSNPKKEFGII